MKKIKAKIEKDGKELIISGEFKVRGFVYEIHYKGDKSLIEYVPDAAESFFISGKKGRDGRNGYKVTIEEEGEFDYDFGDLPERNEGDVIS